MKTWLSLLLITLTFPLILTCCNKKETGNRQPNIVIIFSDELDPGFIGCYGGDFPTPNLDRLAAEGIRFTNAYSAASMCTPSRFGLLTGLYPGRCTHPQFRRNFIPDEPYSIAWNTYIDSNVQTISRQLSRYGYLTGMTGKWHVGSLPAGMKFPDLEKDADPSQLEVQEKLRLFQELAVERVRKDAGFDHAASVLWGNYDEFPVEKLRHHNFPWITRGAVDFIEKSADSGQPFFLYLANTAVHGPAHAEMFKYDLRYTPEGYLEDVMKYMPPDDLIKNKIADYSPRERHRFTGIACLDHQTGIILSKLDELGLYDNTIIIYMSDHNVEPGKSTCYEKGNRVPLIIRWPGKIEGGSLCKSLVQSVDLIPTLLAAAGVDNPEDIGMDGKSMISLFKETGSKIRDYVYLEAGYCRGITDGKYKYIAFRPPLEAISLMESGKLDMAINHMNIRNQAHSQIAMEKYPGYFDQDQLYDLEKDPYEQNNLASDPAYRQVLKQMQEELRKYLVTFDHPFSLEEIPFMKTEQYRQLAEKAIARGTDWIPWLQRDHGGITWPPEE